MPRTISTKPDYSVRWWSERGLKAPKRETFKILRGMAKFRLEAELPALNGQVKLKDARHASKAFPSLEGKVSLVVTSPPYLDTTDYNEDQWLRLWFLGGSDAPHGGVNRDDRHTNLDDYWAFLKETWAGMNSLLKRGTHVVVRIGGTRIPKDDLMDGLLSSLRDGLAELRVRPLTAGATTEIKNRQTNVFRPGTTSKRFEHDFTFKLTG